MGDTTYEKALRELTGLDAPALQSALIQPLGKPQMSPVLDLQAVLARMIRA